MFVTGARVSIARPGRCDSGFRDVHAGFGVVSGWFSTHYRHSGLDPESTAAPTPWTPDHVRGDDAVKVAFRSFTDHPPCGEAVGRGTAPAGRGGGAATAAAPSPLRQRFALPPPHRCATGRIYVPDWSLTALRHCGLDPESTAAPPSWTPDRVRSDDALYVAVRPLAGASKVQESSACCASRIKPLPWWTPRPGCI